MRHRALGFLMGIALLALPVTAAAQINFKISPQTGETAQRDGD